MNAEKTDLVLTIAAEDCRFGEPEVKFGSGIVALLLPWLAGPKAAKFLLLTGEDRVSAAEAAAMGLVNRVVPAAALLEEAIAVAGRIAANDAQAVRLTKKAINQAEDLQGLRAGMDSVFGLHHFAHAHNAEAGADSLGGHDARSMRDARQEGESTS